MENIVCKIRIVVGICTADVIAFIPPRRRKFLEFRHNPVIASGPCEVLPQMVMYFLPPVQAQYNIVHLAVGKLYHFIIYQNAVRCQRKPEIFVMDLFLFPCVGNNLLHNLPVHQRFPAEKVNLQISAAAGMCNQEVNRLFPDLKRHQCTLPLIFPLAGEAVRAVQVAGVRNMQAKGFYHIAFVLKIRRKRRECIRRKKLPRLFQRGDICDTFPNLRLVYILPAAVFSQHGGSDFLRRMAFIHGNYVIRHIVYAMNRAAACIQHDGIPVQLILMHHSTILLYLFIIRKEPPHGTCASPFVSA